MIHKKIIMTTILIILIGIVFQTNLKLNVISDSTISESDTFTAESMEDVVEETKAVTVSGTEVITEIESMTVPDTVAETETETDTESWIESATPRDGVDKLIVIDAGHQSKADNQTEPLGPGSSEMKARVTGGTSGCVSGMKEYELNLIVAFKLEEILKSRGYQVLMIRTEHNVNISNRERAEIANNAGAGAFIRIHANGSDDSSKSGIMTICQTSSNPYNAALYEQSFRLSTMVLDNLINTTGVVREYVWETDTMSGINWSQVPCTIVEMGYMSNPEEDALLAEDTYQTKVAEGIANGLDSYFSD